MDTVYTIIYGLLALGIIVFVHEMGHFLVAKYFGVRVETFSLGMGPGIIKYKKKDTLYKIGIIPFGGYCKMAGEEPTEKLTGDSGELYSKPPLQRLAIIAAGSVFNYIFGVLLFIIIMAVGVQKMTYSNDILVSDKKTELSLVAKAGLKNNDKIINIDGKNITDWKAIQKMLIRSKNNKEKSLTVQRDFFTIFNHTFKKTIKLNINSVIDPYTGESLIKPYKKNSKSNQISIITYVNKPFNSPAKKAGLKDGDKIIKINGEDVAHWQIVLEKIITSGDKKEIILTVKRNNKLKDIHVKPIIEADTGRSLIGIEPDFTTTKIESIIKNSPDERSGLKKGDQIIKINNKKIKIFKELSDYVSKRPGEVITIYAKRDNKILPFSVKTTNIKGKGLIGISKSIIYTSRSKNIFSAIADGFKMGNDRIKQMVYSVIVIISGKVNVKKAVKGPVGIITFIGDMTKTGGILALFSIMGFISIWLGLFNLLPIPALDGSYIVIFLFEMIFRKKLNYKVIQVVQYIFFFILMGLMVLVTINDITGGKDTAEAINVFMS